jgi:hypothetical protein
MEAHRGDHVIVEGNKVGQSKRNGEVVRVEGYYEHRRIWVRWTDGHESMLIPGPGVHLEGKQRHGKGGLS